MPWSTTSSPARAQDEGAAGLGDVADAAAYLLGLPDHVVARHRGGARRRRAAGWSASAAWWSCRRRWGRGSRRPRPPRRRGRRRRRRGPRPSRGPAWCGRSAPDLVRGSRRAPLSCSTLNTRPLSNAGRGAVNRFPTQYRPDRRQEVIGPERRRARRVSGRAARGTAAGRWCICQPGSSGRRAARTSARRRRPARRPGSPRAARRTQSRSTSAVAPAGAPAPRATCGGACPDAAACFSRSSARCTSRAGSRRARCPATIVAVEQHAHAQRGVQRQRVEQPDGLQRRSRNSSASSVRPARRARVDRDLARPVHEVVPLDVPLLAQRAQRGVDRAGVDVRPLVDLPRHQLAADLVAVDRLEQAHGAQHEESGLGGRHGRKHRSARNRRDGAAGWRRVIRMTRRLAQLFVGLALYGVSLAMVLRAGLGLAPWDVLHQGLAQLTGADRRPDGDRGQLRGAAAVDPAARAAGVRHLRERGPGRRLRRPDDAGARRRRRLVGRVVLLLSGVLLNGLATALYIGASLGPGPRDGLMTGLVRRTGRSVRLVRTCIEVTVLVVGFLLGGTVGVGTLLYALAIGPIAHALLPVFTIAPTPSARARRSRRGPFRPSHRVARMTTRDGDAAVQEAAVPPGVGGDRRPARAGAASCPRS